MGDSKKTKAQLVDEIEGLRQQIANYVEIETKCRQTERKLNHTAETLRSQTKRETLAALVKSESRFRILAESTAAGILIFRESKMVYVNPSASGITGYSQQELLEMNFWEVIHPDFQHLVKKRGLERQKGKKPPEHYEVKIVTRNGEHRWVDFTATVITLDNKPNVLGTVIDITERKQAEEALKESEFFLKESQRVSRLGSYVFDVRSQRWVSSPILDEILGIDQNLPRTVEGWLQIVHPDQREEMRTYLTKDVLTEHQPFDREYRITRVSDGKERWVHGLGELEFADGKPIKMIGTIQDITERKGVEAELKVRTLQQSAVAELGQQALGGTDLPALMNKAVILIAEILDVEYCKVLELLPNGDAFLLKAGVGWKKGHIGRATVDTGAGSQAGYTLLAKEPVVVDDLRTETRFSGPPLLVDHGVVSGMSVIIAGSEKPFGVFGAHTTRRRTFTKDDIHFMQAVANVLATAIERKQAEEALHNLATGVSGATGDAFFYSLVQHLAKTLEADYSFVGRLTPDGEKVTTIAVCAQGEIADNFEYPLADTPCANVAGQKLCAYPSSVQQKFPRDHLLAEMQIDGYIGTPLFDSAGRGIGIMVVLYLQPIQNLDIATSMLQIFAARASAELERLQAEEALQESEERFRSTFEQAAVGAAQVAIDGHYIRVNQRLCDIVGYTQQEMLKKSYHDITHPDDLNLDLDNVRKMLNNETQAYAAEKRYLRKDGSIVWVTLSASLVRDLNHEPKYFISVIGDITDRKRLEEQLLHSQKLEAIGRLAGGIAHDFNNLLTVILGNAEFGMQDTEPGDPIQKDLIRIEQAGTQARDLVTQLLSFSRRQVLDLKIINLNDSIVELSKMLRRVIGENIKLKMLLGTDIYPVKADPVQVQQVLMNLVINARDAMPGGGNLTIRTQNFVADDLFDVQETLNTNSDVSPDSKYYVKMSLEDSGVGMDRETQARIFEPFFTTKDVSKGSGLGLAVIYGIVKQHGGVIQVESAPGAGTTFNIYFPAATTKSFENKSEDLQKIAGGNETILVVEDEQSVQNVTTRMLKSLGYNVIIARNGKEAISIFKKQSNNIDLTLLDVVMPELSGPDTYTTLIRTKPDLPVIFVTGYDVNDEIAMFDASQQESITVLQKPYTRDSLASKVRNMLDQTDHSTTTAVP
ncbi:MAG: PAS domain S-box protein [bacterium]